MKIKIKGDCPRLKMQADSSRQGDLLFLGLYFWCDVGTIDFVPLSCAEYFRVRIVDIKDEVDLVEVVWEAEDEFERNLFSKFEEFVSSDKSSITWVLIPIGKITHFQYERINMEYGVQT